MTSCNIWIQLTNEHMNSFIQWIHQRPPSHLVDEVIYYKDYFSESICCDVIFSKKTWYSALILPYPHNQFCINSQTKAADDGSGGRWRSEWHNNQPSTEGCTRCSLLMSSDAVIDVLVVVNHILDGRQPLAEDGRCNCPVAAGVANGTTSTPDAPAVAVAAARAMESHLQLAGEEHARYYSAAASSLSAPSAVVVPLREGYLGLVCCQQSQDSRRWQRG